MSNYAHASRKRGVLRLAALAAAPSVIASTLGNFATMPNIAGWYEGLAKPTLNPPNWVFGPVWTILYILMAYAFFRILDLPANRPGRGVAILAFLLQMTLNVGWSFAFFAAHSPLAGLIVILALDAAIVATIILFARLDRVASFCLWPYAAWVAFATYLNAALWALNR
jgi:tryptophan-rich sensory protein